jgi:hypothetical protein
MTGITGFDMDNQNIQKQLVRAINRLVGRRAHKAISFLHMMKTDLHSEI